MLRTEIITDDDQESWDKFVVTQGIDHFAHLWGVRGILSETFGHQPYYLAAYRDEEIVGVLPLFLIKSPLFGNSLISVPYFNSGGIITEDEAAFTSLLKRAEELKKELRITYIEFRARKSDSRYRGTKGFPLPLRTHKVAMRLNLPESNEKLLGSFDKKLRSQIKRPQKEGVTAIVTRGESAAIGDFYQVFSKNMRDLGTPVYPKKLFEQVFKRLPQSSACIICYLAGQPLAAGITIGAGNSVEIPWASSLREYNSTSANMLLYASAMEEAIRAGYSVFDFGRSSLDSGTFRFKAQWGAEPKTLHWYYLANPTDVPDVNPNNPKYALMVKAWQQLPLGVANCIGPFLTKGLP